MKRKYIKFTLLDLASVLLLVVSVKVIKTTAGTTTEIYQHQTDINGPVSKRSKEFWDSDTGPKTIVSQVESNGKTSGINPESEEAKEDRLADNKNEKVPNQAMRNNNFSNVDDNYRRIVKEKEISKLPTKNDNIFHAASFGDATDLLGSIEESVRKDFVDISPLKMKEHWMKSYKDLKGEQKPKKFIPKHRPIKQAVEERENRQREVQLGKPHQKLLSEKIPQRIVKISPPPGKKLEPALSNEGKKKTNENKMIYNGKFMIEKTLGDTSSGEDDKEIDEWETAGSGNEKNMNVYNKSDWSTERNEENSGSVRKDLSGKSYDVTSKLPTGQFAFPEKNRQAKTMEKVNGQIESSKEEGSSDGQYYENDDNNDGDDNGGESNAEYEIAEGYENNGSFDLKDNKLKKYSNHMVIQEKSLQDEEYSGYMKERKNENKNSNEYLTKINTKEENNKRYRYKKGKSEKYSGDENDDNEDNEYYDGQMSGESASDEQTSGEERLGEQISGDQISGEAYSGNTNSSPKKISKNSVRIINNDSVNHLMLAHRTKNVIAEHSSKIETSSGSGELLADEATDEVSNSGSGQDGSAITGTESNEGRMYEDAVKQLQAYVSNSKEGTTRENSKSYEGIGVNRGKLQNVSYKNVGQSQRDANTDKNTSKKTELRRTEKTFVTTDVSRHFNSSSNQLLQNEGLIRRNNTEMVNMNGRQQTITAKDNGTENATGFTSGSIHNTSMERVTIKNFTDNITHIGKDSKTVEDKDEKTLQELNKEIRDEEDKSNAMINYLEKIDKELGQNANESVDFEETSSKSMRKKSSENIFRKHSSFDVRNISNQLNDKILMKINKSSDGNSIKNESEENTKEEVSTKQNSTQFDTPSNIMKERKTTGSSNKFANDEEIYINQVIKNIFGDLEEMVEGKLERTSNTQIKVPPSRNRIFTHEIKHDGIIRNIVKNAIRNSSQRSDITNEKKIVNEKKTFRSDESREFTGKRFAKTNGVIVIDLHEKSEDGSDKSKRTERPTKDSTGDIILKYKRIYGANSTLVADFSDGETAAKLYIIPKNNDENAQKKNIVLKNEAAEKRNRMYIHNNSIKYS